MASNRTLSYAARHKRAICVLLVAAMMPLLGIGGCEGATDRPWPVFQERSEDDIWRYSECFLGAYIGGLVVIKAYMDWTLERDGFVKWYAWTVLGSVPTITETAACWESWVNNFDHWTYYICPGTQVSGVRAWSPRQIQALYQETRCRPGYQYAYVSNAYNAMCVDWACPIYPWSPGSITGHG